MKTLGLIGGTSWHSTVEYYRDINQAVNEYFGDNTNPPLVLYNLNQSLIHQYQREGNWAAIANMIIDAGKRLQLAGAEALMCCANTPHKVCDTVCETFEVPMLHIADATAQAIKTKGINKVCFIGTKFTMEADFITGRIGQSGIEVLVSDMPEVIEELHRIIQKELTFGRVEESSKQYVLNTINKMTSQGAEGVILGCTEFPLMIYESDLNVPIFNTTLIHAKAAVEFILVE